MEDCIFCKIVNGEIPANKVLENDEFLAFYDISPVTNIHVLVIPKKHIESLAKMENSSDVSSMLGFIQEVAEKLGLKEDGFRVIFNSGIKAGQTVMHMHAHILGGQELGWPNL